jgi:hypothetical protein
MQARLRYLRDHWVTQARNAGNIEARALPDLARRFRT